MAAILSQGGELIGIISLDSGFLWGYDDHDEYM